MNKIVDREVLKGRTLFIGLGAMKSGTSWVSDYLRQHPQVFHSGVKEINFWNRLDANPLQALGSDFRLYRIKDIILRGGYGSSPTPAESLKLYDLAEIDDIQSTIDYEDYFARRIGKQSVFGEICPQYSLMPPETYRRIEDLGFKTRLLFFMRDPAERLASNIQHQLRRKNRDVDVVIDELTEESTIWQRSDYSITLEAYKNSGVDIPLMTVVYEDLFTDYSIGRICNFLEIEKRKARFDQRINAKKGIELSTSQKQRIREKIDPIYVKLADYLPEKPKAWNW